MAIVVKTKGGTSVSFANSPQAANDVFSSEVTLLTEDSVGAVELDVMKNDLGGATKSLWSLDNDDGSDGLGGGIGTNPNGTTYNRELLTSDADGTVNYSELGAKIWIEGGKVKYELPPDVRAELQTLGANEYTTDTFTYAIRLGNGTLSWATVTIEIAGSNDGPVISIVPGDDDVDGDSDSAALIETNDPLEADGTLTVTDIDLTDTVAMSVAGVTAEVDSGYDVADAGLDETDLGAMLTLTPATVDADVGDAHNVAWSFNTAPSALDFLQADETLTLTYTVQAKDDSGAANDTDTQTVTITVAGTQDIAEITAQAGGDYSVTEDSDYSAGGTLLVADKDHDESAFDADETGTHGGTYGTFQWDASTGAWTYLLDNANATVQALNAASAPLTDTLTVHSLDGTDSYEIEVTINGADEEIVVVNEAPVANDDKWIISQQTDAGHNVIITPDWFLHNDTDAESSTLYVTNVTLAGGAALSGNWTPVYDGQHHLTSISLNNLGGSDVALDYTLSDGTSTSTGHVSITSEHITGSSDSIDLSGETYDYSWIYTVGGADSVEAGPGIDTLAGGDGKDTLIGSSNVDTFVYGTTSESQATYKTTGPKAGQIDTDNRDTIQSFTTGQDKIDLSTISGLTGFDTDLSDGLAAHSVGWLSSGGNTTVYVNASGANETVDAGATYSADMEILLIGTASVSNGDFVLS